MFVTRNSRYLRRRLPAILSRFSPSLAFLVMLGMAWRTSLVSEVPGYGDVLEVIWGMEWYYDQIFGHHSPPLYSPLVFHPNGWHTATLAHTPLLFLIGAAIIALSDNVGLAYNLLALSGLTLAYMGSLRFLRLYTSGPVVIVAALIFTFLGFRWQRIG